MKSKFITIVFLFALVNSFVAHSKDVHLDPINLINDMITGVVLGIKLFFTTIIESLSPGAFFKKKPYDKCNDTGSGLFGRRRPRDSNGKLVGRVTTCKIKCVKPTLFRLILMILCPPFDLFIQLCLRGWFHIIVCTFLTIKLYYYPGFLYSIMHIIC